MNIIPSYVTLFLAFWENLSLDIVQAVRRVFAFSFFIFWKILDGNSQIDEGTNSFRFAFVYHRRKTYKTYIL